MRSYDLWGDRVNFNFIVTRAGVLKEGPNEKEAVTSNWFPPLPWFPITFADLAACSLRALRDKSVYNSYPFVC
ncbi:hypothetical protein MHU86_4983 [Fragilaria crotonensis]|nr:hypothetical protein MHU86_4983 [Fragilaria crotonensis]